MIAWSVLVYPAAGGPVLAGSGLTDTRTDAVEDLTDAIRGALMDASAYAAPGGEGPRYTALVDAERALTVHLTRNSLGRLDLDAALDELERFEEAERDRTAFA
ncbi:hypothetical protein GCM10007304_46910 [Rhodococcoides trifolii]|uniref:Uncharacterized protein n=1 Tax=Rhodococcoides trifolii TaxID=908250 RepID=A0A917LIA7_9NOCA|nr:hypothetical protein [Rhodococcus trifolii]GGG27693.1 hypothetical protein GCM10007304_46910 [Rhodococcus trifolii]